METLKWKNVVRDGSAFHAARTESVGTGGHARHHHDHADFSEVMFVEYGEMDHRLNGQLTRLGPGSMVFVRSCDCHGSAAPPGQPYAMFNVAFPNAAIKSLRRRHPAETAICFPPASKTACSARLDPSRQNTTINLFATIRAAARTPLELDWFLLSAMREILLSQRAASPTGQPLPDWLERALLLIARPENFQKNTRHFATLAGHSPEHVAREVRRHLNTTPTELVNRARLDHAATRLATTQEKIINIALDAGFNHLGHFYRQFQKRHHLTPRAFRLHHTATLPAARTR